MCVSAWATSFSKTITGTWEVLVDGRLMHVLWYQNRIGDEGLINAQNMQELARQIKLKLSGAVFDFEGPAERELSSSPGNCLIIPLMGDWASIRLLNTTTAPNLLFDVKAALALAEPVSLDLAQNFGGPRGQVTDMVFLKFDIYDIVLAKNARDIAGVLSQIVAEKRPIVNEAVFNTLADWYQCPVALCCFNNDQVGESKPLAFAFEPLYPDKIMVYTLDGHDGMPPATDGLVSIDHSIFVGSYMTDPKHCGKIKYSDKVGADLQPYLLNHVMGSTVSGTMENGDLVFLTKEVRAGTFNGLRSLPPHAPSNLPRLGHSLKRPSGTYV